jgi:hypothetical protein
MSKAMPRMVASVGAWQRRRQRDPDRIKRQRRPALSRAARGHARPHHTMAAQRGIQRTSVAGGWRRRPRTVPPVLSQPQTARASVDSRKVLAQDATGLGCLPGVQRRLTACGVPPGVTGTPQGDHRRRAWRTACTRSKRLRKLSMHNSLLETVLLRWFFPSEYGEVPIRPWSCELRLHTPNL